MMAIWAEVGCSKVAMVMLPTRQMEVGIERKEVKCEMRKEESAHAEDKYLRAKIRPEI